MPRTKKPVEVPPKVAPVNTTISLKDANYVFIKGIDPLDLDLGREDLNKLVAKINEIIEKVN